MYAQLTNDSGSCQSADNEILIRAEDAAAIQVYSGRRIYLLFHEQNARGELINYWYGHVIVRRGENVQVLGMLAHYYPSPESALLALREAYPEPPMPSFDGMQTDSVV